MTIKEVGERNLLRTFVELSYLCATSRAWEQYGI